MKIGLLGGTFDPIHVGHLIIAEWIRESWGLKKIIFVPAALPPHKKNVKMTDKKDRLEMVKLSIRDNPKFEISDIEINEENVSFTVDTLKEFSKGDDEIYFIIGGDSLKEFPTWKDPDEIIRLSNIVVARRPNHEDNGKKIIYSDKVIFSDSPEISISSTQIRERVKEGKSIKYLVHPAVEEYILKKGFYKS